MNVSYLLWRLQYCFFPILTVWKNPRQYFSVKDNTYKWHEQKSRAWFPSDILFVTLLWDYFWNQHFCMNTTDVFTFTSWIPPGLAACRPYRVLGFPERFACTKASGLAPGVSSAPDKIKQLPATGWWFQQGKSTGWITLLGTNILLMDKILHHQGWWLSHYLKGFNHPRWCRLLSINSIPSKITFESMIFLFPRWDMLVSWRVHSLKLS